MSRIRSIHPTIWTDDNFAMLQMASRVLLLGIWTEADDHGVFEWKPTTLKMRIFPADNVEVTSLLEDLVLFNAVKKFTHEGREYGLVRNFCRFQRPKKPNYKHVLPDELRTYAGIKAESSEPVPNQFRTSTENSSQMEEEGGRREEERKKDGAVAPTTGKYFFEVGVIRLTKKDFEQWQEAFSNLELRAELISLEPWAAEQPKWFHPVAAALAKRNREIGIKIKTGPQKPPVDSAGHAYPPGIV